MRTAPGFRVVAIGTWRYDGVMEREVELIRGPAPDGGEIGYMVGATSGGIFPSAAAAKAWADRQPWGPVRWRDADAPATVFVADD